MEAVRSHQQAQGDGRQGGSRGRAHGAAVIRSHQQAQVALLAAAALMLALATFGGAYYEGSSRVRTGSRYDVSTDSYRPTYSTRGTGSYERVYLGSGLLPSAMILAGVGSLLYALAGAVRGLRAGDGETASAREGAAAVVRGASVAAGSCILSAALFAASFGDASERWLDTGFWGPLSCSLAAIWLGKRTLSALG